MTRCLPDKLRIGRSDFTVASLAAVFLFSCMFLPGNSQALARADDDSFSFVVFGDSRIPAYAPFSSNQKEELDTLVAKIMKYGDPDTKPDYHAVFGSETMLLEKIVIPGPSEGMSRTIVYGSDGWPDVFVNKSGDQEAIALLASGQQWVYDNVVSELKKGVEDPLNNPTFCLHTGDIVYFGFQGKGAKNSPYWRDFDRRFISRLPAGGPDSLPARFFPTLGNHETWGDRDIEGYRQMFPYLSQFGFNKNKRVYMFDHKNARFIFLDSGIMNPEAPAEWYKSTPGYKKQMDMLKKWLEEAVAEGLDHAFLNFHYPVFCRSGFGPLPPEQNPHKLLQSFAGKIGITVFNGHVHATEIYKVDGVRYFVAGGGGGEQNLSHNKVPDDYPKDLYWQGKPRQLDYNYLVVEIEGDAIEITLKRFRPNEFKPCSQVPVVPGLMD